MTHLLTFNVKAFNNNLLVENYPIKERSAEEIKKLARIKALRRMEIFSRKIGGDLSGEILKKDNIRELVSFYNYF